MKVSLLINDQNLFFKFENIPEFIAYIEKDLFR